MGAHGRHGHTRVVDKPGDSVPVGSGGASVPALTYKRTGLHADIASYGESLPGLADDVG